MKFITITFYIFLASICASFTLHSQTYQTISDGNWQSNGTWLNGNKPNINQKIGNNVHILISHDVNLQGKDIEIDGNNNTLLEVNGGRLHGNGNAEKLIVRDGVLKLLVLK